jgi:hypothetical protein
LFFFAVRRTFGAWSEGLVDVHLRQFEDVS